MQDEKLTEFKKTVFSYFKKNRRDLPWRRTQDPYHILISEVMLQQTQVKRVAVKYQEFLDRFGTMDSLANTTTADVLSVWSGLGYNRRALYLHQTAQKIVNEYEGNLPQSVGVLQSFPGLGKATAVSVLVFSYNLPLIFIETNIRRVFIHFFFDDQEGVRDQDIEPLVEATLDRDNPREWYYALMDYGTMLAATTENPNRRSKQYVKQSKFEGSVRKVRGAIIRLLLTEKHITASAILGDTEKVAAALKGLQKDGLIVVQEGIVSLI